MAGGLSGVPSAPLGCHRVGFCVSQGSTRKEMTRVGKTAEGRETVKGEQRATPQGYRHPYLG